MFDIKPVMMECGCVSVAKRQHNGKWVSCCLAHDTIKTMEIPDMTGRKAKCTTCGKTENSDPTKLAFFVFKGENSFSSKDICKNCKFAKIAHEKKKNGDTFIASGICDNFEEHGPFEYDDFYCGCRGWE